MPIIDRLIAAFSGKKKDMPLNPTAAASDEWSPDGSSNSNASASTSSSSPPGKESSSLKAGLLPKTEKQLQSKEDRTEKAQRFAKSFLKVLASTALNHVTPGLGKATNLISIVSTADHIQTLKPLFEEPCDVGDQTKCQGLVAYAIQQKDKKLVDAVLQVTPVLGTVKTVHNKIHGLLKNVSGEAGGDRLVQAKLLVDHAKECHVALALYAELVHGSLGDKKAWAKALEDVTDKDVVWGLSDENPSTPAANKAFGKLKATT
jgi:hypothetical protein